MRGKKRKLAPSSMSSKVSEKLMQEIGTSSPADVSAEHARQVAIVMKAAINSTHLKGTYIRDLKNVAAFFSAAWKEKTRKRSRERRVEKETRDESTYARVALLEEENATLRRELAAERAARTRESSGRSDQQRKSRDRDRKIEALEKRMEELGPQIARDILEQLTGQKFNHSQMRAERNPRQRSRSEQLPPPQ
jgi:hypothetical protein